MAYYETLSPEISEKIRLDRKTPGRNFRGFSPDAAIRRRSEAADVGGGWASPFLSDIESIMHCPFYNRYADKTQVFSFYKNDDISRRGLHVQMVSRISRTIGAALGLNLDLIESMALGHDIGHTPFGHSGERMLDRLYYASCGRHFAHNIHSARVLDHIFQYNLTLQTLNGIVSHNGECEMDRYSPVPLNDFGTFDAQIESCYMDSKNVLKLVPCSLEGCVVRISDIIAYLGKDRQDAESARILRQDQFAECKIGTGNTEIVNNLTVNIIENSYGKPYISMDRDHFEALAGAKEQNYRFIYAIDGVRKSVEDVVEPMMDRIYNRILTDLRNHDTQAPVFTHHINYINMYGGSRDIPYEEERIDDIAVDYIASMTDDYFVDYYSYLYPNEPSGIEYIGYFD